MKQSFHQEVGQRAVVASGIPWSTTWAMQVTGRRRVRGGPRLLRREPYELCGLYGYVNASYRASRMVTTALISEVPRHGLRGKCVGIAQALLSLKVVLNALAPRAQNNVRINCEGRDAHGQQGRVRSKRVTSQKLAAGYASSDIRGYSTAPVIHELNPSMG